MGGGEEAEISAAVFLNGGGWESRGDSRRCCATATFVEPLCLLVSNHLKACFLQ